MSDVLDKIEQLLRGNSNDINGYLRVITKEVSLEDTNSMAYYHMIRLNGNKETRVKDLANYLSSLIIDYAIPRKQILDAQEKDRVENTTRHVRELSKKAKKLFTQLKKTGEGGEMLLYVFAQHVMKIPQVLCKMSLKTDGALHFQGTDGLHMKYDANSQSLILYWGESKVYSDIDEGMRDCLNSIKPYLLREEAIDRDMELFRDNIDLIDEELENAIIEYLNPDSGKFGKLEFRGICFIGFDDESYPDRPNSKTEDEVFVEIEGKIADWNKKLSKKLKNRAPLDTYKMDIFLLPFPSVEIFRKTFLEEVRDG